MEFKDVVYGRRSVRRFKDTPVDDKILEEIVDAALWAPSGVNLQPWYYVVIRTPEKMTRLKEMMSVVSDRDRPHLEERFSAHPEVVKTTLSFISTLGGAPAVVLAFRDKPDIHGPFWMKVLFRVLQLPWRIWFSVPMTMVCPAVG